MAGEVERDGTCTARSREQRCGYCTDALRIELLVLP